ncbi:MAG: hypothetical protein ACYTXE_36960, partial [Nostoc sp.]
YELWKIDPTTGNPVVIDIVSGSGSSYPSNFTNVNGTLFFQAYNSANGYELWKLDSTGNPVLVKDIYSGSNSSSPSNLFNVNGTLYWEQCENVRSGFNYQLHRHILNKTRFISLRCRRRAAPTHPEIPYFRSWF